MPESWQVVGRRFVRWLFSEQAGTEEDLLVGATFAFLHDLTLTPGFVTARRPIPAWTSSTDRDERCRGCSTIAPPTAAPSLRGLCVLGDAALVRGGEYHNIANEGEDVMCA